MEVIHILLMVDQLQKGSEVKPRGVLGKWPGEALNSVGKLSIELQGCADKSKAHPSKP